MIERVSRPSRGVPRRETPPRHVLDPRGAAVGRRRRSVTSQQRQQKKDRKKRKESGAEMQAEVADCQSILNSVAAPRRSNFSVAMTSPLATPHCYLSIFTPELGGPRSGIGRRGRNVRFACIQHGSQRENHGLAISFQLDQGGRCA